ncbi:kinase-like protein [Calocera viscosa TUFC12733]|uniref:Cyclin-dependent kinase 8 n=1 Tax=Calocera viscosa (strain TUFC12733) TaxID=1330018 RepID=A0A167KST0_CALVF|nr:kinase-like protein [Calocera viscosa TUFC12733]
MAVSSTATGLDVNPLMSAYKRRRDAARLGVGAKYESQGFISSGTYGKVYKVLLLAHSTAATRAGDLRGEPGQAYAVKKFKPEKEGGDGYTGLSQSACREIALNREIRHENVIALREVILDMKAVFMVFEYAEHDFLQVIHYHSTNHPRSVLPLGVLKSLLYQLLNGVAYLHSNFIMHRDLKPANILITDKGVVKIGDLGLARVFHRPLVPLLNGDKVVVTIWYRAPELLLGAKHYTTAIDMWAVGCIFAELLSLRPIFKGDEAKMDASKKLPFQKDQMLKIMEVLGVPSVDEWPLLALLPDYPQLGAIERERARQDPTKPRFENNFGTFMNRHMRSMDSGRAVLQALFTWDPDRRLSAADALYHPFFTADAPMPTKNAFAHATKAYPPRRITADEGGLFAEPAAPPPAPQTNTGAATSQRPAAPPAPLAGQPQAGSVLVGTSGVGGAGQGARMWSAQAQAQRGMARKRPRLG